MDTVVSILKKWLYNMWDNKINNKIIIWVPLFKKKYIWTNQTINRYGYNNFTKF